MTPFKSRVNVAGGETPASDAYRKHGVCVKDRQSSTQTAATGSPFVDESSSEEEEDREEGSLFINSDPSGKAPFAQMTNTDGGADTREDPPAVRQNSQNLLQPNEPERENTSPRILEKIIISPDKGQETPQFSPVSTIESAAFNSSSNLPPQKVSGEPPKGQGRRLQALGLPMKDRSLLMMCLQLPRCLHWTLGEQAFPSTMRRKKGRRRVLVELLEMLHRAPRVIQEGQKLLKFRCILWRLIRLLKVVPDG